jgi:hypothetical protein
MFFNHNEVPEVALPSAIIESRVYRGKGQRVARGEHAISSGHKMGVG